MNMQTSAAISPVDTRESSVSGIGPVETICLNCGAPVVGRYCSACGQTAGTDRLSFPRLFKDFFGHFVSLDSRVLRTFVAVSRRPGTFIREYLLGRRVGYSGPLTYYLLVVALNVGVSALLRHSSATPLEPDAGASFWDQNFVALQISLAFGALMLPLAVFRRLLHFKEDYSIAEHFSFLLFVLAQSVLVILVLHLVTHALGITMDGDVEGAAWLAAFTLYALLGSRGFIREPLWMIGVKLGAAYVGMLVVLAAIGLVIIVSFGLPA
jgi:hypothetical protein